MKLFFQKDVMINRIKKLIQLMIRIKNFVLESPPGYIEYHKAILAKDEHFNYMENKYFKRHVLPYMIRDNRILKSSDCSAINQQQLFNPHSPEPFRVNPVTGLPMIGAYDAGGNPFGFNYNHSVHHHLNHHSGFTNMHINNPFNSFDYWK